MGPTEAPATSLATAPPAAAGPAPPAAAPSPPVALTLVAERNIAPGRIVAGQRFGGISALVFRPSDRRLLALSDGRAEHGPGRMFAIDADRLEPVDAILLGDPIASQPLDLEGMARAADGTLWIATEGDTGGIPRRPPAIWRVDDDGQVLGQVRVPDQLLPTPDGEQRRGVRDNRGIEGLTSPGTGESLIIAAVEQACVQDGPAPTFDRGTRVRLLVYEGTSPRAQHAYLTDPIPPPSVAGEVTAADIGVSALTALDHSRLLVLERASVAVNGVYTNRIRIYQVGLDRAVDVASLERLADVTPVLAKQLVLDFDQILPQMDPRYGRLDNFEAMTLGTGADGSPRLYVASDDNFSNDQRTVLLAFAVEGL